MVGNKGEFLSVIINFWALFFCFIRLHANITVYAKSFWGSAPNPTVYVKFFWGAAPNLAKGSEPLWNPAIWGAFVFDDLFFVYILG